MRACADADAAATSATSATIARTADLFMSTPQVTFSVNGAVRTWPSTRHWRNSRQVPGTGTSTPTVSFPGVDELPATLVAPITLEQPVAPGAQTCVWK